MEVVCPLEVANSTHALYDIVIMGVRREKRYKWPISVNPIPEPGYFVAGDGYKIWKPAQY